MLALEAVAKSADDIRKSIALDALLEIGGVQVKKKRSHIEISSSEESQFQESESE